MGNDPAVENQLHKRLGLRPGVTGMVVGAPDDEANPLFPLPEGVRSIEDADDIPDGDETFEYIHYFARGRTELARVLPRLRERLAPDGTLWISWMKQSSSRRRGGFASDVNENVVRRVALTCGLVDARVLALNQDWSGLRLLHRKH